MALALLTSMFYYIPQAALAGVIMMAVVDMIDFQLVKTLWRVKSEYSRVTMTSPLSCIVGKSTLCGNGAQQGNIVINVSVSGVFYMCQIDDVKTLSILYTKCLYWCM